MNEPESHSALFALSEGRDELAALIERRFFGRGQEARPYDVTDLALQWVYDRLRAEWSAQECAFTREIDRLGALLRKAHAFGWTHGHPGVIGLIDPEGPQAWCSAEDCGWHLHPEECPLIESDAAALHAAHVETLIDGAES